MFKFISYDNLFSFEKLNVLNNNNSNNNNSNSNNNNNIKWANVQMYKFISCNNFFSRLLKSKTVNSF